jgi:hypothetical protein
MYMSSDMSFDSRPACGGKDMTFEMSPEAYATRNLPFHADTR